MRVTIFLLVLYQLFQCQATDCFQEQPLCLTVNLTTLLNVCKNFFKVPCPKTCGVCSAERVKLNFLNSIDPNSEHRIGISEAQIFLRNVNISLDEALVTEINELLMDTKAILTDMHNHFDVDENKVLNLTEVFKGYVSMLELMGVKIKADFKESVASIAEMIRMSNSGEIFLPKLTTLLNIIMKQFDTYPHGLISLNRVQNITNGFFNLERVVVAHQLIYSINIKVLSYYLLTYMDIDNDGMVSQAEYTYTILNALRVFNITLSQKAEENLVVYFDIYQSSVESILNKYGIKESGLLEGMILSEYENRPFVNLVVPIHEAIQSAHKLDSKKVPRYVRSSANTIPPRKLTALSIIEALFGAADKNRDGVIDVPEFAFFMVNSLPKEYQLADMNEALKVLKLYDDNNDDRLNALEFKQLFRPKSNVQAILNSAVPAIARLIK
ncbi:hypothetical protein BpHYR1_014041 [Brachionus plicatilis]|uniref:EF-hand domain-containing protein n=1 Tax=Brachionus plicatilis TaxID=10195 RepID=A0A3M7T6P6_BRAPC|nr:hypothetical protein BpHYR1_014041 [Brachionus plicatilis]